MSPTCGRRVVTHLLRGTAWLVEKRPRSLRALHPFRVCLETALELRTLGEMSRLRVGRKGLFFSADTPKVLRSVFVKGRTFNSGSFHSISGEDPESKEVHCLLFIVLSRNSSINDPIRSTSSSNAKWPVSRRWSSALGISLLKSSAPSTVKIPSFLPHVISVGG
jgi:hypothetical protein